LQRETGVPQVWGEHGYSAAERLGVRPSLSVTGLSGGHSGPGPKSVIPARAVAKLSFRLVPDQDPRAIEAVVRRHLQRLTPPTVKMQVRTQLCAHPATIDERHPAMRAAARAYVQGFRRAPVFLRSGGSIPAVSDLARVLGIPSVLMGFASPEDRAHSTDEKFSLRTFQRAIATSSAFLRELARAVRPVSQHTKPELVL
jgi:acetylornithine deacetylase/succinyl-diaminopimelate desuccinylase-like protein